MTIDRKDFWKDWNRIASTIPTGSTRDTQAAQAGAFAMWKHLKEQTATTTPKTDNETQQTH